MVWTFNTHMGNFGFVRYPCIQEKYMTQSLTKQRTKFGAVAAGALALAAIGFAGAAQARDNVSFSIGVGVPGVQVGVSNAYPVYTRPQPVYVQPQPVYVQPRPVYVQPQPVYVQTRPVYVQPAPVYVQPRPVYYNAPQIYVAPQPVYRGGHRYINRNWGNGNNYYVQPGRDGHHGRPNNYTPVYYSR